MSLANFIKRIQDIMRKDQGVGTNEVLILEQTFEYSKTLNHEKGHYSKIVQAVRAAWPLGWIEFDSVQE